LIHEDILKQKRKEGKGGIRNAGKALKEHFGIISIILNTIPSYSQLTSIFFYLCWAVFIA